MGRFLKPVLIVAGLLALWTAPAEAGPPTDQLRLALTPVSRGLEDQAPQPAAAVKERQAALRRAVHEIFDLEEAARRALAFYWRNRTEAEREEFTALFGDLLERSYLTRMSLHKGERTVYTGEFIDGDRATVRTRLFDSRGADTTVDYRMLQRGKRWRVYDVSFEGMSLIANYRTQFSEIIRTSSYAELVKKLRAEHETAARVTAKDRLLGPLLAVMSLFGYQRQSKPSGGTVVAWPAPAELAPPMAQAGSTPQRSKQGERAR